MPASEISELQCAYERPDERLVWLPATWPAQALGDIAQGQVGSGLAWAGAGVGGVAVWGRLVWSGLGIDVVEF